MLIALIVATLIIALIFSRLAPALLFTVAMTACVLVGAIDMQAVMGKATNEGLVTLLLLLMVSVGLERLPWLLAISSRHRRRCSGEAEATGSAHYSVRVWALCAIGRIGLACSRPSWLPS